MIETLRDDQILPYLRLKLLGLLGNRADLTEQLADPTTNFALLGEIHPYDPRQVMNHILDQARIKYEPGMHHESQASSNARRRNYDRMIYWVAELNEYRPLRYLLLQAPIELVAKEEWHQYANMRMTEGIGGAWYHDYDTGHVPDELKFLAQAGATIVKLLLVATLAEPWWDDVLPPTRASIDEIVLYLSRINATLKVA